MIYVKVALYLVKFHTIKLFKIIINILTFQIYEYIRRTIAYKQCFVAF